MIAGQKLRLDLPGSHEPRTHLTANNICPGPRPEPLTLSWSLSLNQVHLLFALRLFSGQV